MAKNMLKRVTEAYFKSLVKIGPVTAEILPTLSQVATFFFISPKKKSLVPKTRLRSIKCSA